MVLSLNEACKSCFLHNEDGVFLFKRELVVSAQFETISQQQLHSVEELELTCYTFMFAHHRHTFWRLFGIGKLRFGQRSLVLWWGWFWSERAAMMGLWLGSSSVRVKSFKPTLTARCWIIRVVAWKLCNGCQITSEGLIFSFAGAQRRSERAWLLGQAGSVEQRFVAVLCSARLLVLQQASFKVRWISLELLKHFLSNHTKDGRLSECLAFTYPNIWLCKAVWDIAYGLCACLLFLHLKESESQLSLLLLPPGCITLNSWPPLSSLYTILAVLGTARSRGLPRACGLNSSNPGAYGVELRSMTYLTSQLAHEEVVGHPERTQRHFNHVSFSKVVDTLYWEVIQECVFVHFWRWGLRSAEPIIGVRPWGTIRCHKVGRVCFLKHLQR